MKVLVTGANGFLGQAVVSAFLERGHQVRAMVRPAAKTAHLPWADRVEFVAADLRASANLAQAFEGVDALVHLAACVIGDDATHFASTIGGTERLLQAMAASQTKKLVLASTMSVYDWRRARGTMNEAAPLDKDIYERGAYAIAKLWQERVARRMNAENGWGLTVLRPGVIWGSGHETMPLIGPTVGPLQLVVGFGRRLPLSYIDNCADCFVRATEDPRAGGETFNLLDGDSPTAWKYAGRYMRWAGVRKTRVVVPYWCGMLMARVATATSRWLFKGKGKLPSLLMPCRYAIFNNLKFNSEKFQRTLGWQPPVSSKQAMEIVFGSQQGIAVANASGEQNAERSEVARKVEECAQKAGGAAQGS